MASLNFRKIVFSLYFGHPYGKKREETGFSYAKSGLFSLFYVLIPGSKDQNMSKYHFRRKMSGLQMFLKIAGVQST